MKSADLQSQLITYSADTCGHLESRGYIGLSGIGDCARVTYDRYTQGKPAPLCDRLKFKLSNELEAALIARITDLGVYGPRREIVLHGGLVQGHTDGELDGDLLEIKTLACEKYIPTAGKIPTRIYWQVQAYLRYGPYRLAHLLYLARDTGAIVVLPVVPNRYTQDAIARTIDLLVNAVAKAQRPICTCDRCS